MKTPNEMIAEIVKANADAALVRNAARTARKEEAVKDAQKEEVVSVNARKAADMQQAHDVAINAANVIAESTNVIERINAAKQIKHAVLAQVKAAPTKSREGATNLLEEELNATQQKNIAMAYHQNKYEKVVASVTTFMERLDQLKLDQPQLAAFAHNLKLNCSNLMSGQIDLATFKTACVTDHAACKKEVDTLLTENRKPATILEFLHEAVRHLFRMLDIAISFTLTLGKKTAMDFTPGARTLCERNHFFNPLKKDSSLGEAMKSFDETLEKLEDNVHTIGAPAAA